MLRHEVPDFSSFGAAYTQTFSPTARVVVRVRLRIDSIEPVITLINPDTAVPAELIPGIDMLAILGKNLYAIISAVSYKQSALRIHCQRVRRSKLPIFLTPFTKRSNVSAICFPDGDSAL